jgi:hypothetical protein
MRLEKFTRRMQQSREPWDLLHAPRLKEHGGDRMASCHPPLVLLNPVTSRQRECDAGGEGEQNAEPGAAYEQP